VARSSARGLRDALDLLRLVLAYCLGHRGLRSTAAWAAACGLANLSNLALLGRLRGCGGWLGLLVGQALAAGAPPPCQGRLIRLIDATTVRQAGARRGVATNSGASTAPSICRQSASAASS
jgi:hypothetical protein